MFLKCAFKNSPTFALAAFVVLTSMNGAVAQTSVSYGQIRNLPAIDTGTRQETSKSARLFTINEKKSLPPVSQFNKARIVIPTKVAPAAQFQSASAPPVPPVVVTPPLVQMAIPESTSTVNAPATSQKSRGGHYTVSFASPAAAQQIELDSPSPEPLETDNLKADDVEEDLESSDADDLNLSGDDESVDELDYEDDLDEDDSPIARPEFGAWPSKSIQEVRLDLVEHGAESPQDRSEGLFASSQRNGGNIAATEKLFAWAAPNINYQPLYFEDVALERYGQTEGLVKQPFVSAGRFLADRLFLGTRAMRVCPKSCDSPLGYCRPGSPSTTADGGCGCACQNDSQSDCQSCQ